MEQTTGNSQQQATDDAQLDDPVAIVSADGEGPLGTKVEVLRDMKVTKVTRIPLEVDHLKATHYLCLQVVDENGNRRRVIVGFVEVSHPGPNDVDMWLDRQHGEAFFTEAECLQRRMNKPLFPPRGTSVDKLTAADRLERVPEWAKQVKAADAASQPVDESNAAPDAE